MKKILLSVLLVAMLAPMAMAVDMGGFRFGLKASPSVAWLRPETSGYEHDGVRLGFSYGFISDVSLGDFYAFSTGLNINIIGGKLEYQDFRGGDRVLISPRNYNLQYLEIPLTIKMHTQEIGYLTYYGRFGFGAGVNLRSKAKDSYNNITEELDDIKGDTRLFRASLIVGLGVEYSLGGKTALVGGVTFNNGFTNVLKGTNEALNRKPSAINNFLELTFGIMF